MIKQRERARGKVWIRTLDQEYGQVAGGGK